MKTYEQLQKNSCSAFIVVTTILCVYFTCCTAHVGLSFTQSLPSINIQSELVCSLACPLPCPPLTCSHEDSTPDTWPSLASPLPCSPLYLFSPTPLHQTHGLAWRVLYLVPPLLVLTTPLHQTHGLGSLALGHLGKICLLMFGDALG